LFDASIFGLSLTEAIAVDPQARLMLQLCGEALAAPRAGSFPDLGRTGVFLGMTWTDYTQLAGAAGFPISVYTAQGAVLGVTPGRISYHFGLQGPAVALETACSSALVAANAARESVQDLGGAALAGGVNFLLSASTTYNTVRAGMLTQDGRCKALDASADGYVRSEGCAVMLMAAHANLDAQETIIALAGTAVNQDGRSSALTAPNGPAQQQVVRLALANAGITPIAVAGISLHGTGTSLGDPIEVGAASAVLFGGGKGQFGILDQHKVAIQASKASVGHAEPASGILSLNYLHQVRFCRSFWFVSMSLGRS
jgi:acyl transferase domain-containing protein